MPLYPRPELAKKNTWKTYLRRFAVFGKSDDIDDYARFDEMLEKGVYLLYFILPIAFLATILSH